MIILENISAKTASLFQFLQQMLDDISKASGRVFSPSDDDYPKSGVQPFEGDIPDTHHQDSSW
ncbi:MAG: hypothetical protein AAFW84_05225 [Cyanobacteria bacterium J06635_15]